MTTFQLIERDGKPRAVPKIRSWLCGSAGNGKSTTLKTIVQHLRLKFQTAGVAATVELTAYTGVAAFNIGFGAKTACSSFQISPKAKWKKELTGEKLRRLEEQWGHVVLLIIDEISFIGSAFFARMHFRVQQGKRRYFSEAAMDPMKSIFGDVSMLLVGDFGQLEPIDDVSLCDKETRRDWAPPAVKAMWGHVYEGRALLGAVTEAIILSHIHRSKDDVDWTESCLRLRDFECTWEDYEWWLQHDLDRGHLNKEQKAYFENHAVWLCARHQDVGSRNGQKLAHLSEDEKKVVHQIYALHSDKKAKGLSSNAFDGLRSVINLVRGCSIMLTRNVAYKYGLANGTRGKLVGVVYGPGGLGTFPEAVIVEVPDYCGPEFYPGEPQWVPILHIHGEMDGSQRWREQFPLVAGYALTVNKAQGLTLKEGVVIHLIGTAEGRNKDRRFRPASIHGLPFVAWTRSENFAMTAFKNLPPWSDFVKGKDSDMLRMRRAFVDGLKKMHQRTLAKHSSMKTPEDELAEYARWRERREKQPKRQKTQVAKRSCPECDKWYAAHKASSGM